MNTDNDYKTAIATLAIRNKNFHELSSVEKQNLMYLFVRDKFVDLCRDKNIKTVLIKFYANPSDLVIKATEIISIINDKIITTINLDLEDEKSNIEEEYNEAFPELPSWHPEDNFYKNFGNNYDDEDIWQQQEFCLEEQYETCG